MAKHLRIASDLHLEAFVGRKVETLALDFLPKDDRDAESVLILAGDISSQQEQLIRFLAVCLKRFERVLYVPGNHEYYRQNYDRWNIEMKRALCALGPDLFFTTDGISTVDYSGVRFIFGTMWADGGPTLQDQGQVGFYLNDFRLITRGDGSRRFTVPDMQEIFKASKKAIMHELSKPWPLDTIRVVVTHHLPSRRLVSKRFWPGDGSDGANGGFVGQCDDILATTELCSPDIWIHGHTHDTIDTRLWETRIVCNPAAYRGEWHTPHNKYWTAVDGRVVAVPKFIDIKEN